MESIKKYVIIFCIICFLIDIIFCIIEMQYMGVIKGIALLLLAIMMGGIIWNQC